MEPAVRAALACPDCRGHLNDADSGLVCKGCGRRFVVEFGVPRLLPSSGLGPEWEAKQELGEAEYEAKSGARDELAHRFARFADVQGLVLDVGSGVERRPAYLEDREGTTFVGLDPLLGSTDRDFDFVQGLAERLPFADGTFDGAISATMLDHVPDPRAVLLEVRRVLRPNGRLAVWLAVVDDRELKANALGNLALPARQSLGGLVRRHGVAGTAARAFKHLVWNRARAAATTLRLRFARRQVVSDVYADRARYHFSFFEVDDVLELLQQAGFSVHASERVETEGAGTSLFVLAEATVV
jgi:SAM-dependent methyltransferase